jgi:hypothetical protein
MKIKNSCPICLENYQAIAQSQDVCDFHLSWFVTHCDECNKITFSNMTKLCLHCAKNIRPLLIKTGGFAKDHRWMIRLYGFEN